MLLSPAMQDRSETIGRIPKPIYQRSPQFMQFPVSAATGGIGRALRGINDGKGFVLISHLGEVYPSRFLPLSGGNVRRQSLADIYRNSPLFRRVRDSKNLEGKCGICEYREICGGSRARSFAMKSDLFAEEPCCVYEPKREVSPREKAQPFAA